MRSALSSEFKAVIGTYEEKPRTTWVFEPSVQNMIVVSRLYFTADVNAAFDDLEDGNEDALKVLQDAFCDGLPHFFHSGLQPCRRPRHLPRPPCLWQISSFWGYGFRVSAPALPCLAPFLACICQSDVCVYQNMMLICHVSLGFWSGFAKMGCASDDDYRPPRCPGVCLSMQTRPNTTSRCRI
jgi:hypothetical protein